MLVKSATAHRGMRRDSSPPGFTLLELMLVLAIIAVMAALTVPSITNAFKNEKLRKAGELLRNEFAKARFQAMESGMTYEFKYLQGGATFQVNPRESFQDALEMSADAMNGNIPGATGNAVNPFAPTTQMLVGQQQQDRDGIPGQNQLVKGVTFVGGDLEIDARAMAFEQAGQDTLGSSNPIVGGAGQWSAPILFYPDGTTSDAQLILGNEHARYVVLRLRSLTGMCRVSDLLLAEEVPQ